MALTHVSALVLDGDRLLGAVGGAGARLLVKIFGGIGGDHDAVPVVVGLEHVGCERVTATVTGARRGIDPNLHSAGHCTGGSPLRIRYIDQATAERADTIGPLGSFPTATDVAEAIAFLASDRARTITGEILNVAAGAYMRT